MRRMMSIATGIDTDAAQEAIELFEQTMASFSWRTVAMVAGLLAGSLVFIKVFLGVIDRAMERARLDRGVRTFLRSGLKVILWLVAICIILGYLGVPMTSLVAVLSVLGLALSLAIQGLLGNLAGGIMLLTARPFSAGDWVEAGGVGGTVREVGLIYTKLTTIDNKAVYVPNGDISGKTIINYSAEGKRQLDMRFSVSYDAKPEDVKACIARVIGEHPKTFPTPAPMIRVFSYDDSSIRYVVRCWCATEDYWTVYYDLNEQIKAAFDQAGVEMTYPHVNVHMMEK